MLDFRCVEGLRTLCSISVVMFHCFLYLATFDTFDGFMKVFQYLTLSYPFGSNIYLIMKDVEYSTQKMVDSPALRITSHGNMAVDLLFIISGVFSAWKLVPKVENQIKASQTSDERDKSILYRFVVSKCKRLLIPYGISALLALFFVPHGDVRKCFTQLTKKSIINGIQSCFCRRKYLRSWRKTILWFLSIVQRHGLLISCCSTTSLGSEGVEW